MELHPLTYPNFALAEVAKIPNFGTVVDFASRSAGCGLSQRRIGDWRLTHPELNLFVAYGVHASFYFDGRLAGLGHGSHIGIEGRGTVRFYWFGASCFDWNDLLIPKRIVADWDREITRQLHFPDLKWFDPCYGFGIEGFGIEPSMGWEELVAEIKRRVAIVQPCA